MKEGAYMLGAAILAWAIAQAIKTITLICRQDGVRALGWKMVLKMSMKSGGMPSGHTAMMAAVTTFLGLAEGFDSEIFALAFVMFLIVAYDAVNVRHAVGEQGKMLRDLVHRKIRIVEGHTVAQMLVGLALGVAVGGVAFVLFRLINGGF